MNRLEIAINSYCSRTPTTEESICALLRTDSPSRKTSNQSLIVSLDLQSTPKKSIDRDQYINSWENLTQLNDRLRRQLSEFELNKVREITTIQNKLFDQNEITIKNIRQSYEGQLQLLQADNQRLKDVIGLKNEEILRLVHTKQKYLSFDDDETTSSWLKYTHTKESEFKEILKTLTEDFEEQKFQIALLEEENRELVSQLQNSQIERNRERDSYEQQIKSVMIRSERQICGSCQSSSGLGSQLTYLENYHILENHVKQLEEAYSFQIQNLMYDIKQKQEKMRSQQQLLQKLQTQIQRQSGIHDINYQRDLQNQKIKELNEEVRSLNSKSMVSNQQLKQAHQQLNKVNQSQLQKLKDQISLLDEENKNLNEIKKTLIQQLQKYQNENCQFREQMNQESQHKNQEFQSVIQRVEKANQLQILNLQQSNNTQIRLLKDELEKSKKGK